jgi:hypothetical protein
MSFDILCREHVSDYHDIFIADVSYHHVQRSTLSSRVHARSLQSLLFTATDLTKYPLIDSSLQQRHVQVLLQRVLLEQRISYLSIANVQRLSRVVKHAQVRNDIMSSIRLRPSTSLARMPGIVSSVS